MRSLQALVLALVLAAPWAAGAQAVTDRFTVTPRGGFIHFDRASSLKSSGALSVNASYSITPMFAVGFVAMALVVWLSIALAFRARPVYAKLNSQLDRYQQLIEPLRKGPQ